MTEPYALLTVHGYKTIITPATDTNHRGWLAIHATREWPDEARGMLDVWPTVECLTLLDYDRERRGWPRFFDKQKIEEAMPRGAIVGVAWLAKTEQTNGITERWNRREDRWQMTEPDYNDVPCWEPSFGDFQNGRRAWWLTSPLPLKTPIPVEGWPGMWDTNAESAHQRTGAVDVYDKMILNDLCEQGITLPEQFDDAFWRLINRRGVRDATLPRNM